MKKVGIVGLIILILFVIFYGIFFNKEDKANIVSINESITTEEYQINVNDVYQANYMMIEDLNYKFDKYLAIDLSVKNIAQEDKNFVAIDHFLVDDGSDKSKHFIIDENKKAFMKTLKPNEVFDITLTFPVNDRDEYTLYFDESIKKEDEKKLGFRISGANLEKKDVKQTKEHELYNDLKKRISESKEDKGEE